MQLTPGTRLGPYEILSPLGAGGMGEVYRARDTRLGRDVAVKVLPQHLSSNSEVRARFEREAKTVSSLNHPHICTLFDVGREGDTDYLVMELIEGETLATKLARGPLPVADVLKTGVQIADALSRAHRAGVVHRDLKPGNVMLTKSGAKLMDFGLARATGLAGSPGSGTIGALTQSPTVAQPLTAEGTIVGTFQYMSPEQLEGREADARSDVWALGCVLYEMATGQRAFDGRSQASLISSIMKEEPRAMAELVPMSPPALERLVRLCLAKDPDDRIQTAHDVKLQLEGISGAGATSSPTGTAPAVARTRGAGRERIAWTLLAVVTVAAAGLLWNQSRAPRPAASTGAMMRFGVTAPPGHRLGLESDDFAISPGGTTLAFLAADSAGSPAIWLRDLDDPQARRLDGTDDATSMFWSPDGRSLAFFAGGKLRKVAIHGGAPEILCDAPDPRGGAWSVNGEIVFAPQATGGLFRVSADGGEATEVFRADSTRGETGLRAPHFLPGGTHLTFVSLPLRQAHFEIFLGSLETGERELLMRAGTSAVFAAPGYLVVERNQRLVAQRFDLASRKLAGEPVDLRDAPLVWGNYGAPAVSASNTGVLAYSATRLANTGVYWYDRAGRRGAALPLPAGRWDNASISPDGARVVLGRTTSSTETELWLVEPERGITRRLVPDAINLRVRWSPDSNRIVYQKNNNGPEDMFIRSLDGNAETLLAVSDAMFKNHSDWTPDGKWIVYSQPGPRTGWDVLRVPVDGGAPEPLAATHANEQGGWVSPDQKWVLFISDESGREELYVQPYPEPGSRRQLTTNGSGRWFGLEAVSWSPDGREILFFDGELRSIAVDPSTGFSPGVPRTPFPVPPGVIAFAVTADHRRFLVSEPLSGAEPDAIGIDVNWNAALERQNP